MGPETWLGFFVPDPWRPGNGGGVDVEAVRTLRLCPHILMVFCPQCISHTSMTIVVLLVYCGIITPNISL